MPRSKLRLTMETMQQRAEDCLRLLCEHGVDLNARVSSDSRQTALHLAVQYGALPAVGMLASYGANVNLADMIGMTPLHMAAGVLNTDITTCLIELGADVNRPVESSGNTPLHLAVWAESSNLAFTRNRLSCITVLLEGGAKPDSVNHEGRTPLHEACRAARKEVVDILLRYGADVNKLSAHGENCLFLFLEHKPNLNEKQLLEKLLYLTLPPRLTNSQGLLPRCLELPEHARQRSQLINFAQQPRDLHSLCKIRIYQLYGEDDKPTLSELLPSRVVDFIFDYWESPIEIDFSEEDERPETSFQFHPNFVPQNFPNAPPRFWTPQNISNTQSNATSSHPGSHNASNFPNISQNVPNTPQDFTAQEVPNIPRDAANIPQPFSSLQHEFYSMLLQNFATRGGRYPHQGVPNSEGGSRYPPQGLQNPGQRVLNIPQRVSNIPQRDPNIPQGVPNISRGWPYTQRAFQHIPGVIPAMASVFPNMPPNPGSSNSTSNFPTFPDFTNFSHFNND